MLVLLALASVLVIDAPPSRAEIHQEYQAVQRASGRATGDQVQLAYWCEAHGLTAERMRHLALAVLADPTNAAARGLLGLVQRDGRWLRPEAVTNRRESDPKLVALLAEYDGKRSTTPYTADAQFALGVWAEDQGLEEQAKAHFTAATRLEPGKDVAWKRLGYVKRDGRWVTDAQRAAEKADADAQKTADRKWKNLLEKWKAQLDRPTQRTEAEANLLSVTDPRAVASVGHVFGSSDADGPRLVQLLGQIDAPAASRALADLAAFSPAAELRRTATETLRGRDPREYAGALIAQIRDPIQYEVKPVGGPGSPGVLTIETKQAKINRRYAPPPIAIAPTDRLGYDPAVGPVIIRDLGLRSTGWINIYTNYQGLKQAMPMQERNRAELSGMMSAVAGGQMSKSAIAKVIDGVSHTGLESNPLNSAILDSAKRNLVPINLGSAININSFQTAEISLNQLAWEAQRTAIMAQQQLIGDTQALDRINADVNQSNDRIVGILNSTTGQSLKPERETWTRWYVDMLGYRYNSSSTDTRPTFVENVPLGYQPQVVPVAIQAIPFSYDRMSCFGAGTLVQTMNGPLAIETLHIGDMVLTQSTTTGALGYQPILVTHHNPPSGTFRIKVGGDEVVASAFHRFWVARRGWVMARDLKAGDPVRTLGGVLPVESVEAGKVELVYNLDVAEDADFFAGSVAALVHDNSLPDPRLVPFDKPAEVAAQ